MRSDPWREELRRRDAERVAAAPPPLPPPIRMPAPEPEVELLRRPVPVAIIGPTVRTLTRRPVPRQAPPPPPLRMRRPVPVPEPPRRDPITGPVPVVRRDEEQWPDLEWSPGREKKGPLPPPGPLPVPDAIREKVASPLGQVDEVPELGAETWFPPARPTFKGAKRATAAARPRRSEPLRGR